MSSWEICLPWRNLEAAGPRSAWRWERPRATTETQNLNWFAYAEHGPSGHSAKSLSHERWSEQRRALRTNWPILAEACVHGLAAKRLRLWLQSAWDGLTPWRGMLRSLQRELECGQSEHGLGSRAWVNPFTGVFPSERCQKPHRPHSHRHIAPASGGSERPEHDAESGRDLLRRSAIRHSA